MTVDNFILAVKIRVMKGCVTMPKKGENIYKRKDGRWEGRYIREYQNGKAKYGYVFAYSYKEVKRKLNDAKSSLSSEKSQSFEKTEPTICLFSEIADEWLCVNQPQWKISSIVKYTNILKNYLLPEFQSRNITDISRDDVLGYISKLLMKGGIKKQGLAPKTVNSILSVMKNIFEYAADNKGYALISFKGLSAKTVQKPMRILSNSEQTILTEYLMDSPTTTGIGIMLSLYTGIRVGELCALKWEDISFEEKCIHIRKTMQRIQVVGNLDYKTEIIITSPKSECSIRDIPIPDKLIQILLQYRRDKDTYVLTGSKNNYVEPRTMQNRFQSLIKKLNLAPANFHALRHTFATRCIELGFDIKSLSEILGHASVNIALNRYVHPSMELKQRNMNKLSDLLAVK